MVEGTWKAETAGLEATIAGTEVAGVIKTDLEDEPRVFMSAINIAFGGPILILGLLGSLAGNIHPLLAYPLNACNGFLVTILIQSAEGGSSLPFASVRTPGVSLLLVVLFYAGCVPPVVAGGVLCGEHKSRWAALLLLWSALWLALVAA
jgi:competence protein ComEC